MRKMTNQRREKREERACNHGLKLTNETTVSDEATGATLFNRLANQWFDLVTREERNNNIKILVNGWALMGMQRV